MKLTRKEIFTLIIVAGTILVLSSRQFIPGMEDLNKKQEELVRMLSELKSKFEQSEEISRTDQSQTDS